MLFVNLYLLRYSEPFNSFRYVFQPCLIFRGCCCAKKRLTFAVVFVFSLFLINWKLDSFFILIKGYIYKNIVIQCIPLCLAEAPSLPRALHVSEKGSRSVVLSWSPPEDGNSPLTQYTLKYRLGESNAKEHLMLFCQCKKVSKCFDWQQRKIC